MYQAKGSPGTAQHSPLTQQDLSAIFKAGDPQRLVEKAEELGKTLAERKLTTSQIRNIFGQVRQIEMQWHQDSGESFRQAILLKPKLAYFAKRHAPMEPLANVLSQALDIMGQASKEERRPCFLRFVEFFEAVLAYHKKHGGE